MNRLSEMYSVRRVSEMSNAELRALLGDPAKYEVYSASRIAAARIELRKRSEAWWRGLFLLGWRKSA